MSPRTKKLRKRPIRDFSLYLGTLLKQQGQHSLIDRFTLAANAGVMKVTCHDDDSYLKLKPIESSVPADILDLCGLQQVIVQYDVHFAVWKALQGFDKQGVTDFSLAQLMTEVNKLPPERAESRIKNALRDFTLDLADKWAYRNTIPKWLLDLRGNDPAVQYLGKNLFRLTPKKASKAKQGKRASSKIRI